MEHTSAPMLSHGTHPDHGPRQNRQANDGVAHSSPPPTYWPPNTHAAQAPMPTQYSHTPQSVRSNLGPPGPAFYSEMRSTVMPTSISSTQAQAGASYGVYYHGQVDPGIQAASAPTHSMSSAATWSQISGATAYSTYHHAQDVAMDTSTAYPYGQSSATSIGVTEDTREPAFASSAQPQDSGLSSSIAIHEYVETQGVSEARQVYAAPIPPVVFHSYHDGPRMSITVELYPRSEMPVFQGLP